MAGTRGRGSDKGAVANPRLAITLEVCRTLRTFDFRSDPADQFIAATSVLHRVPLVTRDKLIRKSRLIPLAR